MSKSTRIQIRAISLLVASLCLVTAFPAAAQAPLMLVNDDTEVRKISFNFVETKTFEETQLEEQIALEAPSLFDKLRDLLPLLDGGEHPFDPVALQKDVVRLRLFYNRNGFLHPDIDYPASQLDTADNRIHVVFKIDEGPPVIIQDVDFRAPDDRYAYYQFGEERRETWIDFRNSITVHTGDRYTDFDRRRIEDQALTWLKNSGYAFATVRSSVQVDSTANTADLTFRLDTGPIAFVDSIQIQGNESVSDNVVLRELPFEVGDRFREKRLVAGQRELFGLNLFRLALVEVPEQPRDTSVTVRVRLIEASPRYINAQAGFGRETGASLEALWSHRNFFGGARDFSANLIANSGYLATIANPLAPSRLFRASVSLRQPYLFINRLSGIVSPFVQYESDPLLRSDPGVQLRKVPLDLNVREIGVNTTLIYEILPFRTISLQHTFSRSQFFQAVLGGSGQSRDRFNKSVFTLSGQFGRTDDYVRPSRGFLITPFVEAGGHILASDINYAKYGSEFTYYRPVRRRTSLGARLFIGSINLLGNSRYNELDIFSASGRIKESARGVALLENRFDRIRFYAGGGNDVRGWGYRQLGPVAIRADSVWVDEDGEIQADVDLFDVEQLGGLGKVAGNLELRLPFPGLDPPWSSALFMDFGQVYEGPPTFRNLRYSLGTGMRYETLVGSIRLDVAFKLNPTLEDLNDPEDVYLYRNGLKFESKDDLPGGFMRRLGIHFSIGQAF